MDIFDASEFFSEIKYFIEVNELKNQIKRILKAEFTCGTLTHLFLYNKGEFSTLKENIDITSDLYKQIAEEDIPKYALLAG